MQNIREQIVLEIKKAVKDLTGLDVEVSLDRPKDEEHGDYSANIAMTLFQKSEIRNPKSETNSKFKIQKYKTPLELARKLVELLNTKYLIHNTDRIEAVAPGFINFWLSEKYLLENVESVLEQRDKFGSKEEDPNKKVVVEYSSPNIAKPFTVGHLRSTIIGDAIANLLQANGWKVYRDNHLGDWGTQFGKQIYAIKTWGDEEKIERSQNPVKELVALYVKFHEEAEKNPELEDRAREWFKKLEDGDTEAKELWKKCVEWSLKEFKKIYNVLGVEFTENNGVGFGESFFEDKMGEIINELEKKGLLKESEGAKLVFFPEDPSASSGQAKYPPLMIIKKDGATLYATRDLATDKFRLNKYGKDIVIINEVGIEQSLYFKQIFEIEKMLGWVKDGQRIHKKHGHYRFKDEKMSTRKGNVIWLEDVLTGAVRRASKLSSDEASKESREIHKQNWKDHIMGYDEVQKVAIQVGIGALKWNDLKRTSEQDIVFDWDEILNMEGNSGPYLQYTFARTQSVVRKSQISNLKSQINSKLKIQNAKLEMEEALLLRAIQRFPEIVEETAGSFSPNLLCNYLFDLSQKFNLFYQKHKILSPVILSKAKDPMGLERDSSPAELVQNDRVQDFRLALTQAVGQVIKNGLYLLGISAPEKM